MIIDIITQYISVYLGKLSQEQLASFRESARSRIKPQEDKLLIIPISKDDLAASVDLGLESGLHGMLEKHPVVFF